MNLEEGHVVGGRVGLRGEDRRLIGTCFVVQMYGLLRNTGKEK